MLNNKNVGLLISGIHFIAERKFNDLLQKEGLTELSSAQGRIIMSLYNNKQLTCQQLCKETALAKSTVSTMLSRMEGLDMIYRERNTQDSRSVYIGLTERGMNMIQAYLNVVKQMSDIFYVGIDKNYIDQFESTLERVYNNLKKEM